MGATESKVAVVTGAASGIGLALSEACVAQGMSVAMADVEVPELEAAAERLDSAGHSVLAIPTDVRSQEAVDSLAAEVTERLGPPDLVCNNAGVAGPLGMSWELPVEVWQWVLETNLFGVIHGVRSFVPEMVDRDRGQVINISSIGGLLPLPASAPYSVTKFGIVALTEALAEELKMRGSKVRASVAMLGEVRTRITEDLRNWPADLGPPPEPSTDCTLVELGGEIEAAISEGVNPAELAPEILRQAAEGQLWIHSHLDENREALSARAEAISGG